MDAGWDAIPDGQSASWTQLLDAFLRSRTSHTARAYHQAIVSLAASSRKAPPDVELVDMVTWLEEMRARGAQKATQRARIAAVRSWYKFLRQARALRHDPAEGLPSIRVAMYGRAHPVQEQAFKALLSALGTTGNDLRTRTWLKVHVQTGRRRAEIGRMRWEDIEVRDGKPGFRYVRKGGQDDWCELPAAAMAALEIWRRTRGNPERGSVWEVSESALVRSLKAAAARAGLDPKTIRTHGLRHLAALLVYEQTRDVKKVQRWLRHQSSGTTDVYLQALEEPPNTWADSIADKLFDE